MELIMFYGRVGIKPALENSKSGNAYTRFGLATADYKKNEAGEREPIAKWHDIVAFGVTAENLCKYVDKGDRLLVHCTAQYGNYITSDDKKIKTTTFVVNRFEFVETKKEKEGNTPTQKKEPKPPPLDFDIPGNDDLPF